MPNIEWNYMTAPSGADALGVISDANATIVKSLGSLSALAKQQADEQKAANTNIIANLLAGAKTPDQLNSVMPLVEAERAAAGQQYDQAAIRSLMASQPEAVAKQQALQQTLADSDAMKAFGTAYGAGNVQQGLEALGMLQNPAMAVELGKQLGSLGQDQATLDQQKLKDYNSTKIELAKLEAALKGDKPSKGGTGGKEFTDALGVQRNEDGTIKVAQKPTGDQTAINNYEVVNGEMQTAPTKMVVANWGNTPEQAVNHFVNKLTGNDKNPEGFTKNPNSTANGVGQLIDDTFYRTVVRHAPNLLVGRTKEQVLALKGSNPEIAKQMFLKHTQDNVGELTRNNIPITPQNLYGVHWFGLNDFTQLRQIAESSPNTPISKIFDSKLLSDNRLKGTTTAKDMMGIISDKIGVSSKPAIERGVPAEVITNLQGDFALAIEKVNANFSAEQLKDQMFDGEAQKKLSAFKSGDSSFGLWGSSGGKQLYNLAQTVQGFNELGDSDKLSVVNQLELYNKDNEGLLGIDVGNTALKKVALETIQRIRDQQVKAVNSQVGDVLREYKIKLQATTRNYGATKWTDEKVVDLFMPNATDAAKKAYVSFMRKENVDPKDKADTPAKELTRSMLPKKVEPKSKLIPLPIPYATIDKVVTPPSAEEQKVIKALLGANKF